MSFIRNDVLYTGDLGECFWCWAPTHCIDISYEAHYCGSKQCAEEIDTHLRWLEETR